MLYNINLLIVINTYYVYNIKCSMYPGTRNKISIILFKKM